MVCRVLAEIGFSFEVYAAKFYPATSQCDPVGDADAGVLEGTSTRFGCTGLDCAPDCAGV